MSMSFKDYENIIKKYQETLSVDVVSMANEMGVKVFTANDWSDNLSGMIKREGDDKYSIYVNSSHSQERQRFTIAHELAHFLLHASHIGDGIVDDALYRSGLSNYIESEANAYAAEILMPHNKVVEQWKKPETTLSGMAKEFNVSEQAMAIKLGVPN